MGAAVGLGLGASALSSFSDWKKDKAEDKYYKKMAEAANLQAAQVEGNAKRQGDYMFMDAAQQNSRLSTDYATLLGQQKTALAASGLGSGSATAQTILKNSRLNALMDQEALQYNINNALYENNTSAALEALNLRLQGQQYDRVRKGRGTAFSRITGTALGLLNK